MATTTYFEETVVDQEGEHSIEVEFGRSSHYSGSPLRGGRTGSDSIYLKIDGKTVIMDLDTAKRFVEAAYSVGRYHGLID